VAYDLALNAKTHDLIIKYTDFLLIDNAERIAQQIKVSLWEWRGEWFLDSRDGVPYIEYILVKNPNLSHIKKILTDKILSVDGVNSVSSLTLDFDRANRTLDVEYVAITEYGTVTSLETLNY
jgi:hypothetical protein